MTRRTFVMGAAAAATPGFPVRIRAAGPRLRIIDESMLPPGDGESINGPSLIRVPDWVRNPLGRYYLYFAHHTGSYIRMAYADRVEGPWRIHGGGVLGLTQQKAVSGHIASPDIAIDHDWREIALFYHGPIRSGGERQGQQSSLAFSSDGLRFSPVERVVGPAYLRVFRWKGAWYGLAGGGTLVRAASLHDPFAEAADIIGDEIAESLYPEDLPGPRKADTGRERFSIRHVGADLYGDLLIVYFTCVGHSPERILATAVRLKGEPSAWRAAGTAEVLRPQHDWEGAKLALAHSLGGQSRQLENGLRDPAVFVEEGRRWLLYSAAGEHGIGIVRIEYD